jgi:hypothetical protein
MSKKMASIILAYGIVLATLSLVIQKITPVSAKAIVITGIAGGGLCVLWGIVALTGYTRRAWAVLTMIAVAVVLLIQVVQAWLVSADETSLSLTGRLVLTFMLPMTVGMLIYLLYGGRPPEFYDPGAALRESPSSRRERAQSPITGHHA